MFKTVRFDKLFNIKWRLILVTLFVIPSYCFSQDSTYVQKFDNDFTIQTSFGKKFTSIGYEHLDNEEITYKPNNPVSIGLGLSWKGTNLSFGYGFDFMRDKERGKTHSLDFQYHYYGRKVIFDIFFQRYRGFYTDDEPKDKTKNRSGNNNDNVHLYPDIKIRQYGVFGQYVFNGKKFSTKAVFSQNEIQRKSVGSFLLGGGIYYNKLQVDSTQILGGDKELNNFQLGVNTGYAYTWVVNRRFFISGSVSVGVNFGAKSFDRLTKDKLQVYPTFFPRFAMSYNHNSWSVGLSAVVNRIYVIHSKETKVSLNSGAAQITFVKRFDSLPILSNLLKNVNL